MLPNTSLAEEVRQALRPLLGRYELRGADKGLAWCVVRKSFAMVNDGLATGTTADGLEAVFALYPDPTFREMYEMGDGGEMKGILYHACVLKQWADNESVMPAYNLLRQAFPLMSLSSHRDPREIPSEFSEALAVWVPIQTD